MNKEKLTPEEIVDNQIYSEAKKIADKLGKFKDSNLLIEKFIVNLVAGSDLSFYEAMGILDEAKNVTRQIFLAPSEDSEEELEEEE